jgi:hypothetical protein
MDRFVEVVLVLESLLFHLMGLFLKALTNWIIIVLTIKVNTIKLEAYGDSLLVVQRVSKVCQCLNGSLYAYLDKCPSIISCMD